MAALCSSLPGCAPLARAGRDELPERARAETERRHTPSVVVAVVHGATVTTVTAAGYADLSARRPATPDTVYMLFSISKLVTATAVAQLHERGLLSLDDPIRRYLPELEIQSGFERPVTIRHLLNHSSGLPNPSPFQWARPLGQPRPELGRFLRAVLRRHGRLRFEPGSGHLYSNVGYLVLGRLVEVVTGDDFEAHVTESLLRPIGMSRTGFDLRRSMFPDVATGYVREGSIGHHLGRLLAGETAFGRRVDGWVGGNHYVVDGAPYGGLVGSARDLARFAAMHLGGGVVDGRRILDPETVRMMQEMQRTTEGCPMPHALGWRRGRVGGELYLEHLGSGGGYRPALRLYPRERYAVVVLTNSTRYDQSVFTETVFGAEPAPPDQR